MSSRPSRQHRLVTVGSSTSSSTNYRAYGLAYRPVGTEPVFKYTGKPQSQSTGLYYYGARWYNTTLARFLTRDPKNGQLTFPQSLNPYIYVLNNPLRYTNPTGMDWWNPLSWKQALIATSVGINGKEQRTQPVILGTRVQQG